MEAKMANERLAAILRNARGYELDGLHYLVKWNELVAEMRDRGEQIDLTEICLEHGPFYVPSDREIAYMLEHDRYEAERDIENFNAKIIDELKLSRAKPSWDFEDAIFDNADLRGVKFSGARLLGATFKNADIFDCEFTKSDLSGTNFQGADIGETKFDSASLEASILHSARIVACTFRGCNVSFADFRDTTITLVQLEDAEGIEDCAPHTLSLELKVNKLLAAFSGE